MKLLGPIFSIDLVTSSRRRRYYLVRVIYAVILLMAFWSNYSTVSGYAQVSIQTAAYMAEGFFYSLSVIQLVAVIALAPALAAGTVALERERRTIEYLFASDLTNAEIVLGKFAARLLHLGGLVAVGLPVLSLAMLLGGIDPERLLIMFLITLSTMVMVLAVSIAISVWTPRARDAVVRAYLVLFVLFSIVPLLNVYGYLLPRWLAFVVEQATLANPFVVLMGMRFMVGQIWSVVAMPMAYQLIFAAVCSLLALWAVRRVHLKAAGKSPAPDTKKRWRRRLRRPPVGNRAMLWKEMFAEQAGLRLGFVGRTAVVILMAAVVLFSANRWWNYYNSGPYWSGRGGRQANWAARQFTAEQMMISTLLACLLLVLLAARAATAISSERDRQCWDSLLLTPLSAAEIVWAKILGNFYAVRLLLLPLVGLLLLITMVNPAVLVVLPLEAGIVFTLMFFVTALGTYVSLRSRDSLRAIGTTLGITLSVGGGYLLILGPWLRSTNEEYFLAFCMPFLIAAPIMELVEPSHNSRYTPTIICGGAGYAMAACWLVYATISRLKRSSATRNWDALRSARPSSAELGGNLTASLGKSVLSRDQAPTS